MKNQASLSRFHKGPLYPAVMSLDARIRAARQHMHLSQQDFGARFGVTAQAANQWEKPERSGQARRPARPSRDNLVEMARMSGVRLEWLLSGTGDMFLEHVSSEDVAADLDDGLHVESADVIADRTPLNPDEPMSVGKETGRRGIPVGATPQLDVTAGMGGGGLTIISDGVPGKHGMTFAAEHVRDYWRLPQELLSGMGLHASDVIVLPVQGDSMAPTLVEGEFVFIDTRHRLPSPDGLYALVDDYGGLVVKRLETLGVRDEEMWIKVISDNTRHAPKDKRLSDTHVIGRVVRRFGVVG